MKKQYKCKDCQYTRAVKSKIRQWKQNKKKGKSND